MHVHVHVHIHIEENPTFKSFFNRVTLRSVTGFVLVLIKYLSFVVNVVVSSDKCVSIIVKLKSVNSSINN